MNTWASLSEWPTCKCLVYSTLCPWSHSVSLVSYGCLCFSSHYPRRRRRRRSPFKRDGPFSDGGRASRSQHSHSQLYLSGPSPSRLRSLSDRRARGAPAVGVTGRCLRRRRRRLRLTSHPLPLPVYYHCCCCCFCCCCCCCCFCRCCCCYCRCCCCCFCCCCCCCCFCRCCCCFCRCRCYRWADVYCAGDTHERTGGRLFERGRISRRPGHSHGTTHHWPTSLACCHHCGIRQRLTVHTYVSQRSDAQLM